MEAVAKNAEFKRHVLMDMVVSSNYECPVRAAMEHVRVHHGVNMEINDSSNVWVQRPQGPADENLYMLNILERVRETSGEVDGLEGLQRAMDREIEAFVIEESNIRIETEVPAHRYSRFAAGAVVALRAKLGKMSCSRANELVLEREYIKLCRDRKVRKVYIALHWSYVKEQYFRVDLCDQEQLARRRLPRWVLDAIGEPPDVIREMEPLA